MKRVLIAVATFGGALWAGWQLPVGPDMTANATSTAAEPTSATAPEDPPPVAIPAGAMTCAGGTEGPLGVEMAAAGPRRVPARASGPCPWYVLAIPRSGRRCWLI